MMRQHLCRVLFCCVFCLFRPVFAMASSMPNEGATILIVPERFRIVQLAFDLNRLRSLYIVSYRSNTSSAKPILHIWNGSDWIPISFSDLTESSFIEPSPSLAILIGDNNVIPPAILTKTDWPFRVERLETLLISDLINGLDQMLDFQAEEWKYLSRRHDLYLKETRVKSHIINPYKLRRSEVPIESLESHQKNIDTKDTAIIFRETQKNDTIVIDKIDTQLIESKK